MATKAQLTKLIEALKAQEELCDNVHRTFGSHEWANPLWVFAEQALTVIDPNGWIYWYCYDNCFGTGGLTANDKLVETVDQLFAVMGIDE